MPSHSANNAAINDRVLPAAANAMAGALPLSTLVLVLVLIITGGAG
jgi:hypothetical protein